MDHDHWLANITGNAVAWALIGIPAALAWAAMGLAWLLNPHLGGELVPLTWAMCAAGGWYALVVTAVSGTLGLMLLALSF